MSPDLSSAVLLADDLLGGIVAAYPEFAGERDMHLDLETGPAVDDQPSGRGAPEFGGVPGEIIRHERGIERQLAEAGYYVLPRIGERNVLKTETTVTSVALLGDSLTTTTFPASPSYAQRQWYTVWSEPTASALSLISFALSAFLVRLGGNFLAVPASATPSLDTASASCASSFDVRVWTKAKQPMTLDWQRRVGRFLRGRVLVR